MPNWQKIIIWSVLVLVIISLSGVAVFFLLEPKFLGNTFFAINANRLLVLNRNSWLGIKDELKPNEIIAVQTVEYPDEPTLNSFLYVVRGKYNDIDVVNQVMYIKTPSGNIYGLKLKLLANEFITIYDQESNGSVKVKGISKSYFGGDSQDPNYLDLSKTISFQWEDKRTLTQIYADLAENGNKIVNTKMTDSDFQRISLIP